eukprot:Rmarinus@m.8550
MFSVNARPLDEDERFERRAKQRIRNRSGEPDRMWGILNTYTETPRDVVIPPPVSRRPQLQSLKGAPIPPPLMAAPPHHILREDHGFPPTSFPFGRAPVSPVHRRSNSARNAEPPVDSIPPRGSSASPRHGGDRYSPKRAVRFAEPLHIPAMLSPRSPYGGGASGKDNARGLSGVPPHFQHQNQHHPHRNAWEPPAWASVHPGAGAGGGYPGGEGGDARTGASMDPRGAGR